MFHRRDTCPKGGTHLLWNKPFRPSGWNVSSVAERCDLWGGQCREGDRMWAQRGLSGRKGTLPHPKLPEGYRAVPG